MIGKRNILFVAVIVLILLIILGIISGSESISLDAIYRSFFNDEVRKSRELKQVAFIIQEIRIPRVITDIVAGMGLAVAGLVMQSYFRNALAGPYILGISSGAGLGVALYIMAGIGIGIELTSIMSGMVFSAIAGSLLLLFLILIASRKIGNGSMLLILGLMMGTIASAIISLLQYFSGSEAIKKHLIWTMGNTGSVDSSELFVLAPVVLIGISLIVSQTKALNALLLGDYQAMALGISTKKVKTILIIATGIVAGAITAYCGPIAFLGLSVPHIAKLTMRTSNHKVLIPATLIMGAIFLLLCDIIAQLPSSDTVLPVNVITSLLGAPIVILIILRQKRNAHVG